MKKWSAKIILTAIALTVSTSCSNGSAGSPPNPSPSLSHAASPDNAARTLPTKITLDLVPMILDPSKVPPASDPAVNDATVAGVDSNNNGIRDDVERWIAQMYSGSAKMRAAMSQMALNSQKEITSINLDKNSAYEIAVEGMNATHCAGDVRRTTGTKWDIKQYISTIYNTRPRYSALMSYQEMLGSRAISVPEADTCTIPLANLHN